MKKNEFVQMKEICKIFFIMLFFIRLSTNSSLKFNMEKNYKINIGSIVSIPLICQNNQGKIIFTTSELPGSLSLNTSDNIITGKADLTEGAYPILINALDSAGNTGSTVILINAQNINLSSEIPKLGQNNTQLPSSTKSKGVFPNLISNANKQDNKDNNNARGDSQQQQINLINSSSNLNILSPTNINKKSPTLNFDNPNLSVNIQKPKISQNQNQQLKQNATVQNDKDRTLAIQTQRNANKAISNLLYIVDKKNQESNSIKSQVSQFQKQLQDAQKKKLESDNKILKAGKDKDSAQKRIQILTKNLDQNKDNLVNLQNTQRMSTLNKNNKQNEINSKQAKIKRLEKQKAIEDQNLKSFKQKFEQNNNNKLKLTSQINEIKKNTQNFKQQKNNLINKINNEKNDIQNKQNQIKRLEKLITDTKKAVEQAEVSLSSLINQEPLLSGKITNLQNQIIKKQSKEGIPIQIQEKDLTQKITKQQGLINALNSDLKKQKQSLQVLALEFTNLNQKLTSLTSDVLMTQSNLQNGKISLSSLNDQYPDLIKQLKDAEFEGSLIKNEIDRLTKNSNQLADRYYSIQKELIDYNKEIEKVKDTKQKADINTNAILQKDTQVLLSVAGVDQISSQDLTTKSIANRLAIKNFQGNLYSTSLTGDLQNRNQSNKKNLNLFICKPLNAPSTVQGIIQKIYENNVSLKTKDDKTIVALIGQCSKLYSMFKGRIPKVGDSIYLAGIFQNPTQINVYEAISY